MPSHPSSPTPSSTASRRSRRCSLAFLTWHDRPFRKTHNLVEIGEQCAEIDSSLEPLLRRAAPLTEYASGYRYPGWREEPTSEEAEQALSIAREVHRAVLHRLPEDVRP